MLTKLQSHSFELTAVCSWKRPERWRGVRLTRASGILIYIEQGQLRAEISDKSLSLSNNDILWIPPQTPYYLHGGPAIQHNIRVSQSSFDDVLNQLIYRPQAHQALSLMRQIRTTKITDNECGKSFERGILLAVFSYMLSLPTETQQGLSDQQFSEILMAFERDPSLNVSQLAQHINLTADWFSRCFNKRFGISPRDWLTNERLNRAAELLQETTLAINDVAKSSGIPDHGLFSKQFRKRFGCSPRHWRQTNKTISYDRTR